MSDRAPSLFRRLVVRLGLVLVLGASLLTTAAYFYGHAAADRPYDQLLRAAARQIAGGITYSDGQLNAALPLSAFEVLGVAPRDRIFYSVIGPNGDLLAGYEDLDLGLDLERLRSGAQFLSASFRGEPVRAFAIARALPDPEQNGWAYVTVAQTTEARGALALEITRGALVIVAIMTLIALAGMILAVGYALRPMTMLADALQRRDPEDLTPLNAVVPLELQPFTSAINHFMGRLEDRVVRLQRFIADAAHQIRTPLTALSAQIDMLDEGADATQIQRIQHRTSELSELTNQLLSHAMVIHRAGNVPLTQLDLVDVARASFNNAIPFTVDPDLVIAFEAPPHPVIVHGDAVSLREAIANIVSNSLKHGALSRLDVRVGMQGELAWVEVEDDGPGIPKKDWEKVRQRFNASDGNGATVSGLGFAIAAEVAAAHGGQIRFRNGNGFSVILEIPLLTGATD